MDQKQQQQDQQSRARSKWPANQESANPPPPLPPQQKCPRCESLNTKFCYYNNYSLTQPRYFCKTCRRYWTQGGTLRNVPVGGGCRKGKRPRPTTATSSSSPRSQPPPPPAASQPPTSLGQVVPTFPMRTLPWMRASSDGIPYISPSMIATNINNSQNPCISAGMIMTNATTNSIYPAGGFLSSLASMQSFNQHQGINQGLDLTHGLGIGGSSSAGDHANNSIFPGFNFQLSQSFQLQQANQEKDDEEKNGGNLHGQPATNLGSWIHRDNNINNPTTSNINFWNSSGGGASDGMGSSSLNANPWPNLPGFGGPP